MDDLTSPFLTQLEPCRRVLLMGAGGGFDIFSGIPLHHHLRSQGKEVFLANLSFSRLAESAAVQRFPGLWEVGPEAGGNAANFPECHLSRWFAEKGQSVPIHCFAPGGVQELLTLYRFLLKDLDVDGLVLVDGGTDSLLRGDEPGLGSPGEDVASIAAAHLLELPVKLLASLGFGIDRHHHVCHAYVLEAAADLTESKAFLGAFSLLPCMEGFQALAQAVAFVEQQTPNRPSIVASSIVAAGQGRFGDYHATARTRGSRLFVNPLMSMYWCFKIDGLARRCLYLEPLLQTRTRGEVTRVIRDFRDQHQLRPWLDLPF